MLKRIETLLKEIGKKHNTYCTFTMFSGHGEKGVADYANSVDYGAYISAMPSVQTHTKHKTLQEVLERFERFLAIDDLLAENRELAEQHLEQLKLEKMSVNERIEKIETILRK